MFIELHPPRPAPTYSSSGTGRGSSPSSTSDPGRPRTCCPTSWSVSSKARLMSLSLFPSPLNYCVCKFIVAPPSFRINGATLRHTHAREKTGLHTSPCSIEEITGCGKKASKFTHRWRFMTIINYEKLFNGNVRD